MDLADTSLKPDHLYLGIAVGGRILVELETIHIYASPSLENVYKLGRALLDVGVPPVITNALEDPLPSPDEISDLPARAGAGPYSLAVYSADVELAGDILKETFG